MSLTRFVLAVHCHQPVGNFPWILEEAYSKAYRPFLNALQAHPQIPVVLHYSGVLLDWFDQRHPEFLRDLKALVRRGQVEILGGGYYEPILTMIPQRDALGQIERMRDRLTRLGLSGQTAGLRGERASEAKGDGKGMRGIWLSERVWEPELPSLLAQAGIAYTIVDDHHLALAGVEEEDRFGYYLTEDRGASVALFPSSKRLRYAVPFKPVEEAIGYLSELRSDRDRVVVLADDGEKFGLWPGTHRWVHQEGWLEAFFKALEGNRDWLKLMTFRQCLETLPPLGKRYVPCASYEEMLQWSGGFFRNFLAKYPEADTMHKKMLWLSERLQQAEEAAGKTSLRFLRQARHHLYMGQGNDAYWHGIFGGLYLRHLRFSVYHHLLKAEEILDGLDRGRPMAHRGRPMAQRGRPRLGWGSPRAQRGKGRVLPRGDRWALARVRVARGGVVHGGGGKGWALALGGRQALFQRGKGWAQAQWRDWGVHQGPEILLSSLFLTLWIDLDHGGQLVELSDKQRGLNLLDTLTRRPEAYHARIRAEQVSRAKEPVFSSAPQGLPAREEPSIREGPVSIHEQPAKDSLGFADLLVYDSYRRAGLIDHLLPPQTNPQAFSRGAHEELGDFVEGRFKARLRESKAGAEAILSRQGSVTLEGNSRPLGLVKRIAIPPRERTVRVTYSLANLSAQPLSFLFGSEINLSLKDAHVNRIGQAEGLSRFSVTDPAEKLEVSFRFSRPARLIHFPLETLSDSEQGIERTYQGVSLTFLWPLDLASKGSWTVSWELSLAWLEGSLRNRGDLG